jgi:DNA ligase-1
VRCRAVPIGEGKHLLLSSQEKPFFSVPHISNALKLLGTSLELDGELYCHGLPFEDIDSIVCRPVNLHPHHQMIKYHIFDCADESLTQTERMSKILRLPTNEFIEVAPFYLCYTFDEVMRAYDDILENEYEGMIVRHFAAPYVRKRSVHMMKFKPKKEDTYEILGVVEETSISGSPKKALGAFICSGEDGTPFKVGTGFSQAQRRDYWKRSEVYIGKMVRVQYQALTSGKKVPRFPVFMEVIEDE